MIWRRLEKRTHTGDQTEAIHAAQHAAMLVSEQYGALDELTIGDRVKGWKRSHVLDGVMRSARGYYAMAPEQDAYLYEVKGAIRNTRNVTDPSIRYGVERYEKIGDHHEIAMQGAHPIVTGPDAGKVHYFTFKGDVISGTAKYMALRPDASRRGFVLGGADAWRHAIPHLTDIPGTLNLQDPERPSERELAHISPATVVSSLGEYLRKQGRPAPDQEHQAQPGNSAPGQENLFPYIQNPLPQDEQWGRWGDQSHGGLGGHTYHYRG